jgi:hypothetical protein
MSTFPVHFRYIFGTRGLQDCNKCTEKKRKKNYPGAVSTRIKDHRVVIQETKIRKGARINSGKFTGLGRIHRFDDHRSFSGFNIQLKKFNSKLIFGKYEKTINDIRYTTPMRFREFLNLWGIAERPCSILADAFPSSPSSLCLLHVLTPFLPFLPGRLQVRFSSRSFAQPAHSIFLPLPLVRTIFFPSGVYLGLLAMHSLVKGTEKN